MTLFKILMVFLYGLTIGSFCNVVIYRLPRAKSLCWPASHCPSCQTRLRASDLIPLFSYWRHDAKCRYCKQKISVQYPLIELINALLYLAIVLTYDLQIKAVLYMLFSSLLLCVSVIDLKYRIIPNALNLAILVLAGSALLLKVTNLTSALLGAAVGVAVFGAIILIGKWLGRASFGLGDLKFAAVSGAIVGYPLALYALLVSSILAGLSVIVLLLWRKINLKHNVPYGPFMATAYVLILLIGDEISAVI